MYLFRRLRLFLCLVFRDIESKGGVPDPYRIKGRFSPKLAYEVSAIIHHKEEGTNGQI